MTRFVRRSVAGAAAAALAVSILAVPVALAADHPVDIAGFAFSPKSITVSVGDSVTWANADAQSHTATADDGSFDTGTITGSTPKSVTFATVGTFAYHCKIHPAMTGTVVVEAASATAPTTDTAIEVPAGSGARSSPTWLVLGIAALAGGVLAGRRFRRTSLGG
jgi:plastocyanin